MTKNILTVSSKIDDSEAIDTSCVINCITDHINIQLAWWIVRSQAACVNLEPALIKSNMCTMFIVTLGRTALKRRLIN